MAGKKIYVILINYNGWPDTVRCVDSLLNSDFPDFSIVIVDNQSPDKSVVSIKEYMRKSSPRNASKEKEVSYSVPVTLFQLNKEIYLIVNNENFGNAAGVNAGIKFISDQNLSYDYLWILDNDTEVDPNAMTELVRTADSDENIGVCGSQLVYYDVRYKVQCLGGGYVNKFFGTTHDITNPGDIEKVDYINGASMLISKKCIKEVGVWSEKYFMYYEDVDYSYRAVNAGFSLGIAFNSIIYHKVGASSGLRPKSRKDIIMDLMILNNRLKFSRKFLENRIGVKIGIIISAVLRLFRLQCYTSFKALTLIFK